MLVDILTSFLLAFWPIIVMMSPMMFDAPGSTNDRGTILGAMLFLGYPVLLAFVYLLFGWTFWGVSGTLMFPVSVGLIGFIFYVSGFFHLLSLSYRGILADGYSVSGQVVYYDGKPLEGSDSETFRVLEGELFYDADRYAVDSEGVYYDGTVVEGAIPEGFRRLKTTRSYWEDGQSVYLDGEVLANASPGTFRELDGEGWAISHGVEGQKGHVYHYGKLVEDAEAESFLTLNRGLAKDKYRIFYERKQMLTKADAESFGLYPGLVGYAFDKNNVFRIDDWREEARILVGFDPNDFVPLEMGYVKTSDKVYYETAGGNLEVLPGADAASFELYEDSVGYAFDQDTVYYNCDGRTVGVLEGIDPRDFAPLGFRYAKTSRMVYYESSCGTLDEVEGADPSTFDAGFFESEPKADAKDGRGYFLKGRRLQKHW